MQPSKEMIDACAKATHEVNKAYCEANGDLSQVPWEEAPEWQKESARAGARMHLTGNYGPEASHEAWVRQKLEEGWSYGPTKDPEKKEHPCIVSFQELPTEQQAKDHIFKAVIENVAAALKAQEAATVEWMREFSNSLEKSGNMGRGTQILRTAANDIEAGVFR